MVVRGAECECGEEFMAYFTLCLRPPEIVYVFIDHGPERHLAAGHEITFLKSGRYTFHD